MAPVKEWTSEAARSQLQVRRMSCTGNMPDSAFRHRTGPTASNLYHPQPTAQNPSADPAVTSYGPEGRGSSLDHP